MKRTPVGFFLKLLQWIQFDTNGSQLTIDVKVKRSEITRLFDLARSVLEHHPSKPSHLVIIIRKPIYFVRTFNPITTSMMELSRAIAQSDLGFALGGINNLKCCSTESVEVKGWEGTLAMQAALKARDGCTVSTYSDGATAYCSVKLKCD